jgi:hypothetical protein
MASSGADREALRQVASVAVQAIEGQSARGMASPSKNSPEG